ncbi:MAG: acyl-CoA synthetase, partial [Pseudomonas sp.]
KDLIIRGGHNIDPQMIEEALHKHPAVAMAAAVGKPCAKAGELPVAYVQLVPGAAVTADELLQHAAQHVPERAAVPKDVWIIEAIPLTAVGKTFKPTLRYDAIRRVFEADLRHIDPQVRVEVSAHDSHGQLARVYLPEPDATRCAAVDSCLAGYAVRYEVVAGS